ncbi:hypothetical protein Acr_00g0030050 [Actinidia rufa]|uniref:Uncharacterized protein n=1 Tax=Actinidia rufa TaxID=165716 RepID=A0A7J0DGM3_9ERIC|nr:hypothetical protein Acr_00g0030050 [Actinidia rufa]
MLKIHKNGHTTNCHPNSKSVDIPDELEFWEAENSRMTEETSRFREAAADYALKNSA